MEFGLVLVNDVEFWLNFIQENIVNILTMILTILVVLKSVTSHFDGIANTVKGKAETKDVSTLLEYMKEIVELEELDAEIKLQSKIIPEGIKNEYVKVLSKYGKDEKGLQDTIEQVKEKLNI